MNDSIYTANRTELKLKHRASYDNRVLLPQIKQNFGNPNYEDSVSKSVLSSKKNS